MHPEFDQLFQSRFAGLLAHAATRMVVASDTAEPPLSSFQVHFPRIEFVLEGGYTNTVCTAGGGVQELTLGPGSCLFVPADCWNRPEWDRDVTVLSLLLSPRQLGFSRVCWNEHQRTFTSVVTDGCQVAVADPLPMMLQSLIELTSQGDGSATGHWLLAFAILDHALSLLRQATAGRHSLAQSLFDNVRIYLQENFHKPATRESVAVRFKVSPNHLSRVFRQEGRMGFSQYLTDVRLERAKFMLRRYPFRLEEIARRCGFRDPNYFCRVFKRHVGLTPTEYRIGK